MIYRDNLAKEFIDDIKQKGHKFNISEDIDFEYYNFKESNKIKNVEYIPNALCKYSQKFSSTDLKNGTIQLIAFYDSENDTYFLYSKDKELEKSEVFEITDLDGQILTSFIILFHKEQYYRSSYPKIFSEKFISKIGFDTLKNKIIIKDLSKDRFSVELTDEDKKLNIKILNSFNEELGNIFGIVIENIESNEVLFFRSIFYNDMHFADAKSQITEALIEKIQEKINGKVDKKEIKKTKYYGKY